MTQPTDSEAMKVALRTAAAIFSDEAALPIEGESGRVHLNVEIHVERGRVRWTKGSCFFERRIEGGN